MSSSSIPRRPARLEPSQAEQIPGAEDTLISSEVAHLVAQSVLGWQPADDEQARRLRDLILTGGVDTVSELWSNSPSGTLPGTLWRLYLINQWYLRDPDLIQARFTKGIQALKNTSHTRGSSQSLNQSLTTAGVKVGRTFSPPTPSRLMDELGLLWRGKLRLPLAKLLSMTADFLLVLGCGLDADWITDKRDELANQVTLRSGALLLTAKEMRTAASQAELNNLD